MKYAIHNYIKNYKYIMKYAIYNYKKLGIHYEICYS